MNRALIAKLPFLTAATMSFVLSVVLWLGGHKEQGQFVGLWEPATLALGALIFAGNKP